MQAQSAAVRGNARGVHEPGMDFTEGTDLYNLW